MRMCKYPSMLLKHPQWIMGLDTWFDEAVNYVAAMDFSRSQTKDLTKCVFVSSHT